MEHPLLRSAASAGVSLTRNRGGTFAEIRTSQKELKYLEERYVAKEMKKYAEKVMDEYARNFKREGISSAKDLMWFGKIEHHRYYGHKDKEVLNGERKRGERKEGNQMHIQIIVSRKDASNKIKLSPMNNSKGKNENIPKSLDSSTVWHSSNRERPSLIGSLVLTGG